MYARVIKLMSVVTMAVLFLYGSAPAQTYPAPYLPDKFTGDTAIYSGAASNIRPNLLFIIDDTSGMGQPGSSEPYDPFRTYLINGYDTNAVYVRTAATGGTINYGSYMASISSVTCSEALTALQAFGYFAGKLKKSDGSCNTPQQGNYYLGNFLNYMFSQSNIWQPGTAYTAGDVVLAAAGDGYTWTCKVAGTSAATAPAWPAVPDPVDWNNPPSAVESTGVKWELSSPLIAHVTKTLTQIFPNVREIVRAGLMTFRRNPPGNQIAGGAIWRPVDDIDQTTGGNANYVALQASISSITPEFVSSGGNQQPVNESLWDANLYYQGKNNDTTKYSSDTAPYENPIKQYCQESFVVLITTGASHGNPSTYDRIGDTTGDAIVGYVDDASKRLYDTDHLVDDAIDPDKKVQRVRTIIIQLATPREPRLVQAAAYGNGISMDYNTALTIDQSDISAKGIPYFHVDTAEQLIGVLNDIMLNVVLQAHTAFVAPTIPVSQQQTSKIESGDFVYMGFFRPMTKKAWRGNLKKYRLDNDANVLGTAPDDPGTTKREDFATYQDSEPKDSVDDRDGVSLPQGKINGDFRPESMSTWSSLKCVDEVDGSAVVLSQTGDGGVVDCGGVGEKLLLRTTPRNIYTHLTQPLLSSGSPSSDLTASVNRFDLSNSSITPRLLNYLTQAEADALKASTGSDYAIYVAGAPSSARDNLIKHVHGEDVYSYNPTDFVPKIAGRRMWIMGDVLHSKPVVVGYGLYPKGSDSDCNVNKSMIYVGANDGMLHAFRDCDGEEEWAFIPTNMLGNLRQLVGQLHVNFVDSTIEKFVYDVDKDGYIGAFDTSGGGNDKVLLLFGQRRGGGKHNYEAMGSYYILNVTDPAKPVFLTSIDYGPTYGKLGETWSEPKLAKMKIGSVDKVVMWVGAGYDNCNEDGRFGATQTFQGYCAQTSTNDSGVVTSSSSASGLPVSAKGGGIYAIGIAELNPAPILAGTIGAKIWEYTSVNNPNMAYSIPGDPFLMDANSDGYVDRIYAGDTGGTLWRFDVGDSSTATWQARRVFVSNPGIKGAADIGRKIFYKPDATMDANKTVVYFGTGDREHPLNQAVIDRVYAFFDKNNADYTAGPRTESSLVDVTEDQLQEASSQTTIDQTLIGLQEKDGWFVRLDGGDLGVTNPGEKALASLTLHVVDGKGLLFATTYRPLPSGNTDPCIPGNLGMADMLHFDALTGESVLNWDLVNDKNYSSLVWNKRATPSKDRVQGRSDRRKPLGKGIPSAPGETLKDGVLGLITGSGGGMDVEKPGGGSTVLPLYWRQR